jgi:nitroimidazol reductase NimA-like FMN-containing flavoprotein (pyridoxamine 5'-phosphate oxidase superfamily)
MKSRSGISQGEIDQIINGSIVCHLAMIDNEGLPYVIPLNFGYQEGRLYIHCAPEGKKIEIWKHNPKVCIAFSTDYEMRIQNEKVACSYSMKYRSVLVHGEVTPILEFDRKIQVLNFVMEKYAGKSDYSYSKPAIENVTVFEIKIDRVESRVYGY